MPTDAWQALLPYQSGDLFRRLYRQRNQRSPNEEAVSEIRAHFVQGASYFQAARGAADVVKPLILYYGCLALSRGTIRFLSQDNDAASPKKPKKGGHGLAEAWKDALEENRNVIDLDLTIRSTGTFRELFEVTTNKNYLWNDPAFWQSYRADLKSGRRISIREVLPRIPRLYKVYENTLGQPASCILADLQKIFWRHAAVESSGEAIVEIRPSQNAHLLAPDKKLDRLQNLSGISVTHEDAAKLQIRWPRKGDGDENSPVPIATWPQGPGWADFGMVVLPFDEGLSTAAEFSASGAA